MEELPMEEQERLQVLLFDDEQKRNREEFEYTFDVIVKNWACSYSMWSMPNSDVVRIINGEIGLDDILFEDSNEFHKGMLFEDVRQMIAKYASKKMMCCEARDYEPCLKKECPFFADSEEVGGKYGVCREFKTAFRKKELLQ